MFGRVKSQITDFFICIVRIVQIKMCQINNIQSRIEHSIQNNFSN